MSELWPLAGGLIGGVLGYVFRARIGSAMAGYLDRNRKQ